MLRRFERQSLVYDLTIGGHTIGTTSEHPFFVRGKGWTPAKELQPGDEVRLLTPGWQRVESNVDTGRSETVYNLEIEGDHTYFVGDLTWGWQVWAHNTACDTNKMGRIGELLAAETLKRRGWTIVATLAHGRNGIDIIAQKVIRGVIKTIFVEVKVNGSRLSALQKLGPAAYVRYLERKYSKYTNLSAQSRQALAAIQTMIANNVPIRGIIMRIRWNRSVFSETFKIWK